MNVMYSLRRMTESVGGASYLHFTRDANRCSHAAVHLWSLRVSSHRINASEYAACVLTADATEHRRFHAELQTVNLPLTVHQSVASHNNNINNRNNNNNI